AAVGKARIRSISALPCNNLKQTEMAVGFVKDALPRFDEQFLSRFSDLIRWRRDVRRFLHDPVPAELLDSIIEFASFSPSVGYSQPWRFVCVRDANARAAIRANFLTCNKTALDSYEGDRAELYAK